MTKLITPNIETQKPQKLNLKNPKKLKNPKNRNSKTQKIETQKQTKLNPKTKTVVTNITPKLKHLYNSKEKQMYEILLSVKSVPGQISKVFSVFSFSVSFILVNPVIC